MRLPFGGGMRCGGFGGVDMPILWGSDAVVAAASSIDTWVFYYLNLEYY